MVRRDPSHTDSPCCGGWTSDCLHRPRRRSSRYFGPRIRRIHVAMGISVPACSLFPRDHSGSPGSRPIRQTGDRLHPHAIRGIHAGLHGRPSDSTRLVCRELDGSRHRHGNGTDPSRTSRETGLDRWSAGSCSREGHQSLTTACVGSVAAPVGRGDGQLVRAAGAQPEACSAK